MVKKYILIAAIALSSMQASFAAPWANFFRKVSSRVSRGTVKNVLNKANLLGLGTSLLFGYKDVQEGERLVIEIEKYARQQFEDNFCLVNQDEKTQPTIEDILNTYSPNDKNIKFYAYNDVSPEYPAADAKTKSIFLPSKDIADALLDSSHPGHFLIKGIIGHEIGHIINNHKTLQYLAFDTWYATSAATVGLLCSSAIRKRLYVLGLPLYMAKNFINTVGPYALNRAEEREADFHAIKHAKDFRELRAQADFYAGRKDPMPKNSISYLLTQTHPLDSERAAYFAKAADELEARIKAQHA